MIPSVAEYNNLLTAVNEFQCLLSNSTSSNVPADPNHWKLKSLDKILHELADLLNRILSDYSNEEETLPEVKIEVEDVFIIPEVGSESHENSTIQGDVFVRNSNQTAHRRKGGREKDKIWENFLEINRQPPTWQCQCQKRFRFPSVKQLRRHLLTCPVPTRTTELSSSSLAAEDQQIDGNEEELSVLAVKKADKPRLGGRKRDNVWKAFQQLHANHNAWSCKGCQKVFKFPGVKQLKIHLQKCQRGSGDLSSKRPDLEPFGTLKSEMDYGPVFEHQYPEEKGKSEMEDTDGSEDFLIRDDDSKKLSTTLGKNRNVKRTNTAKKFRRYKNPHSTWEDKDLCNLDIKFPYKCPVCGKPERYRCKALEHADSHNPDLFRQLCPICGKLTKTLASHLRRMHSGETGEEMQLNCPHSQCQKVFISLLQLKAHLRSAHRSVDILIRKGTAEEEELELLKRREDIMKIPLKNKVNGGKIKNFFNKLYPCNDRSCGKTFLNECELKMHRWVHDRSLMLRCSYPGCTKEFGNKVKLLKHQVLHQEKKYTCEECGISTKWKGSLRRHKLSHSGEAKKQLRKRTCKSQ